MKSLVRDEEVEATLESQVMETEHERRGRILDELLEDIRATHGGFKAVDNVPRGALHARCQPLRRRS